MKKIDNLLLIDDDEPTNFYHQIVIDESDLVENYSIYDSAINAIENFEIIASSQPSIMLIDINMPKMDGWEFIEAFAQKMTNKSMPKIFMLTTSLSSFDQKKGEQNPHVAGIFQKPLTNEILEQLAKALVIPNTL